ncbi:hypothetical protein D3C79_1019410 [compost metagenome]
MFRVLLMNMAGDALHFRYHRLVAQQIGYLEFRTASLARAEQLAWASDFQIALGNHKAVIAVAQHLQTFLRSFAQRGFVQQHAM